MYLRTLNHSTVPIEYTETHSTIPTEYTEKMKTCLKKNRRWTKEDEERLQEIIAQERANKSENDKMDWGYISEKFGC
ncbi:5180_t:CDS:2 [Acaulospora colombiana]|uniref:5180_t:CDS:1 n=1 Tax=Acaulospora colombiana TaxID=27376 RepID=A0ACA9KF43_9GLOM|nr:5180_t:CDS:2 [Acaulospora colombiana]